MYNVIVIFITIILTVLQKKFEKCLFPFLYMSLLGSTSSEVNKHGNSFYWILICEAYRSNSELLECQMCRLNGNL